MLPLGISRQESPLPEAGIHVAKQELGIVLLPVPAEASAGDEPTSETTIA